MFNWESRWGFKGMSAARVLCVDDNDRILASLKMGLESRGFEVVTAKHGLDALGEFMGHEGEFNAILTDSDMTYMDGLELVIAVRKEGFRGRIFVMSGNLSPSESEAFSAQGVSSFIQKPFNLSRLVALFSNDC
jgi:DNA-binding NtrC family response regulator